MKGDFEYIDALFRSLNTIKELLEIRGFVTDSMPKFSPVEIRSAVSVEDSTLNFQVPHREIENYICEVRFGKVTRNSFVNLESDIVELGDEKRDIIFIVPEKIAPYHHVFAKNIWLKTKKFISFFSPFYIVINPLKHILVPKHRILTSDETKVLLKNLHALKRQLPIIAFHEDPVGRFIGAKPGDVVHIQRPSSSSGIYDVYRVCA